MTRQAAACASITARTTPAARVQNRSPARTAAHHTTPSSTGQVDHVRGQRPHRVELRQRAGPADEREQPGGVGDGLDDDQDERGGSATSRTADGLHVTPS